MVEYAEPLKEIIRSGGAAGTFWAKRTINGVTFVHAAQDYWAPNRTMFSVKTLPCLSEGWNSQLGWHVRQGHWNGEIIQYAHLRERALVRAGQSMPQGMVFGFMGNTGFSYGEHLHLTICFYTENQAIAKLAEYGFTAQQAIQNIHSRLGGAFVNPVLLIGAIKPLPSEEPVEPEEDEMRHDTAYKATNGQYYREYIAPDGRSRVEKIGPAELAGLMQSADEKKITLTIVSGYSAGDIESIGNP